MQLETQKLPCCDNFVSCRCQNPAIPLVPDNTWIIRRSVTCSFVCCWKIHFIGYKLIWGILQAKEIPLFPVEVLESFSCSQKCLILICDWTVAWNGCLKKKILPITEELVDNDDEDLGPYLKFLGKLPAISPESNMSRPLGELQQTCWSLQYLKLRMRAAVKKTSNQLPRTWGDNLWGNN